MEDQVLDLTPLRLFPTVSVIASIANLAAALDFSEAELIEVAALERKYKVHEKDKMDGSKRIVHSPSKRVRLVQNRIKNRIFSGAKIISWGSYLYGSIPKVNDVSRDYVECASVHARAKSLLKIDVSSFFDNIHYDLVLDLFLIFFKYPEDVSKILSDICTFEGRVPQGGLTSSYIAALILHDVEFDVVRKLSYKGVKYTRYVDDITLSSSVADYDFNYAKSLVVNMLYSKGLPVNSRKTTESRLGTQSIKVHGLRVNFSEARLPRDEIR